MLVVDNYIQSFALNMGQGIPILPFYRDNKDAELKYLADILIEGRDSKNFGEYAEKKFNLSQFYEFLGS